MCIFWSIIGQLRPKRYIRKEIILLFYLYLNVIKGYGFSLIEEMNIHKMTKNILKKISSYKKEIRNKSDNK
jgi:hypothetical protein